MRLFLIALAIIATCEKSVHAQQKTTSSEILSPAATEHIFGNAKSITKYPVRRAYKMSDASGISYLALCESIDEIEKDDTLHNNIRAVVLKPATGDSTTKIWEMNDACKKESDETSIWFWTKFCEMRDLDGDGYIEPLLVYGSAGFNGYDDGRIKILLYYKGQKYVVRHQNSTLDEGRNTEFSNGFYSLPTPILQHIRQVMKTLEEKDFAIFPSDYEKAMDAKKLSIQ